MTFTDYINAIRSAATLGDAMDALEQFRDEVLEESAKIADAIETEAATPARIAEAHDLIIAVRLDTAAGIAQRIRKLRVWKKTERE